MNAPERIERSASPRLQLIPIGTELSSLLEGGGPGLETAYDLATGANTERVRSVVQHTLAMPSAGDPPRCGYLAIDLTSRQIIGSCAFKAPPDADGRAEIAYFTS